MRLNWIQSAAFYHLFPLGALGAPARNDPALPQSDRLTSLFRWLDHVESLGLNAILLGPVFDSGTHGYDTSDYFLIDRRLGSNHTFSRWSVELHRRGLRLVLDGVFHHVGRNFWAFKDVLEYGEASAYRDWFHLDFSHRGPAGDRFAYEGWNGHYDLVKLNLRNPAVREHLFAAVRHWIEDYGIDGLRLDAADVLDLDFQSDLAAFCHSLRPDFWLMGEVIHGDYRSWANPRCLDSATNYEAYKGLFSSHNASNYFEIAYSLNRQFGQGGIYRDLHLYNFVDNHDVERIASQLRDPAHLYPLHALLFTIPGVPSVYYGSEAGVLGRKARDTDAPLRPQLDPCDLGHRREHADLVPLVRGLAAIRQSSPALRYGDYQQLHVAHEQLAFLRSSAEEQIIVAVNSSREPATITIDIPAAGGGELRDLLNDGPSFPLANGQATLALDPCWARVLRPDTRA
jgi:cyclomaltodextrinase